MHRLIPTSLLLASIALAGCASGVPAAGPSRLQLPEHGRIAVSWADPAGYREFTCRLLDRDGDWVRVLAEHARREGERQLPDGMRLALHFSDIDRAGECEPGRSGQPVRIVRDATPPRIILDYRLTAADGQVHEANGVRLTDMGYLQRNPALTGTGTLAHEKRLLEDWLRRLAAGRRSP